MGQLTRKNGIVLSVIGVAIFLFNYFSLKWWNIDIDILGAMLFVLGLVIAIACGKTMKHSSKLFTRRNGVRLCVIAAVMTAVFGYSPIPFLNGDVVGIFGMGVFVLGLIIIVLRWKY